MKLQIKQIIKLIEIRIEVVVLYFYINLKICLNLEIIKLLTNLIFELSILENFLIF